MKASPARPWTVTVTSWFFIVYALFSAIPKIFLLTNPEAYKLAFEINQEFSEIGLIHVPFSFQLAHALVAVPVILLSGIFMLKGRLWALAVFLLWVLGTLVLTLLVSGLSVHLYIKLIVAGIIAALLTRPKSLAYFLSHYDESGTQ